MIKKSFVKKKLPRALINKDLVSSYKKLRFKYKDLINSLHNKLLSSKLTDEQKIRIYFFIKSEEIKNLDYNHLLRLKKKYSSFFDKSSSTIAFLSERISSCSSVKSRKKLLVRLKLESFVNKQCSLLLKKIDSRLERLSKK